MSKSESDFVLVLISTAELAGKNLDYAVALAQGWRAYFWSDEPDDWDWRGLPTSDDDIGPLMADNWYSPSTEWDCAGPLIEEYRVSVCDRDGYWTAAVGRMNAKVVCEGESPMTAACRAIVASKLGDKVYLPADIPQQTKAEHP